ncbi:Ubiquitin-like-specific protease 1D [Ananas comosus]|uniref:Ubiquitin-like-specific protease 1D n=1 Tax=Ananas comosus TaxID=4615 RepID=A0A199V6I3_ANACO|nr:Ubiquitin-like-specific protease 1D [Ananas comosus]
MGKPPLHLNWGELLPAMGDAAPAPELEIVAASSAAAPSTSATVDDGGREEEASPPRPRPPPEEGEMAEFSDHQLQEKLKRVLEIFSSGLALNLPDKGEKLRLTLRRLQLELDRRRFPPPARKDARRFDRLMQPRNAESSGTTKYSSLNRIMMESGPQSSFSKHCIKSSKNEADVAFSEDLGILSRDKCNSSSEYELKTHDEKDSAKPFSRLGRTSSRESPSRSVNSYADKEKNRSSDDNNRDVILSSTSSNTDKNHCTLSARRKRRTEFGDLVGLKSQKVQEVVLLDEDMPSILPTEKDTTVQPKREDTTDEWEHPQSVELSYADIKCLDPESYLSSPIINFYIMYLQRSLSPTGRPGGEYYFFNTYFYNKLEEALSAKEDRNACFWKLRRWWKGVNIFKKAYIFLPVHGEYLKEEWNYMNQNPPVPDIPIPERIWKNLPRRIEKRKIAVPQQKNEYDCGLFVLYFMERFIAEAPERLRRKDLATLGGRRWFRPEEASALRNRIRILLLEEFGKAKAGNCKKELKSSENSDEDG